MCRKLIYLVSFVLMLGLVGNASAADFKWDNSAGDSLWRNPQNWDVNKLPDTGETGGDIGLINWLSDPTEVIIDADTEARCWQVIVSNDATGGQGYVHLHVTGGTLLAGDLLRVGRNVLGKLTVDGGVVTCTAFQLGRKDPSKGEVYINGGIVDVLGKLTIPRGGAEGSILHLDGGVINLNNIEMNVRGTNGSMDITGGVMIFTGEEDKTELIKEYVQNGWITAYGVKSGELTADGRMALVQMDYNVTNPDKTTVRATVGDPTKARAPSPGDGATVVLAEATGISWAPGENAVQHDVYFGASEEAVTNADTSDTTGIYRGRRDGNSYTFPEALEWSATYYWRIDEIEADNTMHTGPVWSFTVADYLLVDDFESYVELVTDVDDYRIFDMWIDGYEQPENGSIVGYAVAPFCEQTIVHGGEQSMPYSYNNTGPANYSEAERAFSPAEDWTREGVGVLSLWFRGYPAYVGSFVEAPAGTYTMTAGGTDIWSGADEFHFAYKEVSGAVTIIAKVESVENTDPFAKAGVMIRDTLDADSANAALLVTPENGVRFQYRTAAGSSTDRTFAEGITAPQWVKLERTVGGLVRAFYSADGATWTQVGMTAVTMNLPVYIGLALTSHNVDATCEAKFSNVSFGNTSVGPEWTDQDIGMLSNEAEPMYLTVGDGSGTAVTVYHDDLNATQIDTWTQWTIDTKEFGDAGVVLTDVSKLAIGFGGADNPQPGGSGLMYFDDIRLYLPR